jgi:endogenous inhibitor of DNA gyrase (YacG/DUF329 family)
MAVNMTHCPECQKHVAIADLPEHLERVHQRHALADKVRKLHNLPQTSRTPSGEKDGPRHHQGGPGVLVQPAKPKPEVDSVECPDCGMVVAKDRLAAHRRLHRKPVKAQEAVKGSKKQPIGEVKFPSQTRGTRVTTPHLCNECGKVVAPVWRYPRSNRGEVHLCSPCKHKVFRRSFDDVDLMNTRLVVEHGRRDDEGRWERDE